MLARRVATNLGSDSGSKRSSHADCLSNIYEVVCPCDNDYDGLIASLFTDRLQVETAITHIRPWTEPKISALKTINHSDIFQSFPDNAACFLVRSCIVCTKCILMSKLWQNSQRPLPRGLWVGLCWQWNTYNLWRKYYRPWPNHKRNFHHTRPACWRGDERFSFFSVNYPVYL